MSLGQIRKLDGLPTHPSQSYCVSEEVGFLVGQTPKLSTKDRAKAKRLMDTYQQTLEEHNAKRTEQKNACAICRRPFSQYQAYQDHDHKCCSRPRKKEGRYCGKCNRGLLCFLCNKKAVAWLEQLAKWGIDIEAVLEYIRHWTREITLKGGYAPKAEPKRKKSRVARQQKVV